MRDSKPCRTCGESMRWAGERRTPRWYCQVCAKVANRKKKFRKYADKHGLDAALRHQELLERKRDAELGSKVCPVCWEEKDLSEFYLWKSGLSSYCKSCTCSELEKNRTKSLVNRVRSLVSAARSGAKKRGIGFSLTVEDVEKMWRDQGGRCFYSGVELSIARGMNAASIDRVDSGGGYDVSNVVLCCSAVNLMKGRLGVEEFRGWCEAVVESWKTAVNAARGKK